MLCTTMLEVSHLESSAAVRTMRVVMECVVVVRAVVIAMRVVVVAMSAVVEDLAMRRTI